MSRAMLTWLAAVCMAAAAPAVTSYEGTVTVPTHEHVGRETEPPLFSNSTVTGMYPFTTYLPAFQPGPQPKTYPAVFLENEYLKLTYIPDFGGRFFSIYDKLRHREMFYRNDVIKPAPYNPRDSWPQSGMELTGPHDLHMLTLHGEPYWAHKVVRHEDGSVSLVLGEIDPVYGMKVDLTATLHPGIAALQIGVSCYNARDGRKPQMLWINSAINATPKTRFIYPMTRTVGHTTADVADWPLYNGIDYSWDRNNQHMLGVFGIDIYDNFQGAYQFDRDYGIFRYADRRIVQGMKLWTFGYGESAKNFERGYTDNAGPYVELQSGRHVWDGHYEWVAPHKVESWTEWWIPVSNTGGLTTLTRDVALKLDAQPDRQGVISLALAATRVVPGAKLTIKTKNSVLLATTVDLNPARTIHEQIHADSAGLTGMVVTVVDSKGKTLLDYHRPDSNPGRKEYTPFTKPLEEPKKPVEKMSVEELTLAGEYQLKELDEAGARALFAKALERDPGYSQAHLLLGITDFNDGEYEHAATELKKAIDRDPYLDKAYYYLAMSQFALGKDAKAERNLYYIWPDSAYYGNREYQLGRLALEKRDYAAAITRFRRSRVSNAYDLTDRLALAVALRESGDKEAAEKELSAIEAIDPTNRPVEAERWFLTSDAAARAELLRLLGGQSQEAIAVSIFYRNLNRWKKATRILELVEQNNRDPWGTTPVFYYTLAYCQRRAGDPAAADQSLKKARAAAGKVDRFPYREETEAPLEEAVRLGPNDALARLDLARLLYFRHKPQEAIREWEAAVKIDPRNFSARRDLGLAYAEQGFPIEKAAAQLELAVSLNPSHTRTLDDLSTLYARAGRFEEQIVVLNRALKRTPNDDDLISGVITANLNMGRYEEAQRLLESHTFEPRHRTYGLRDIYRALCYGMGAKAFHRGDYASALALFQKAFRPPPSLGIDTFQNQASPRLSYSIGRAFDALGKPEQARAAYEKAIAGVEQLSGDRDSWNSENFFMVLALERLGRAEEASRLEKHFENFALTEQDSKNEGRRAEARYLLGLIAEHDGRIAEARSQLTQALEARPDLLAARLALRGDAIDTTGGGK